MIRTQTMAVAVAVAGREIAAKVASKWEEKVSFCGLLLFLSFFRPKNKTYA